MTPENRPLPRTSKDAVFPALLALVVQTFSAVLCLANPQETSIPHDLLRWIGYPLVAGLVALDIHLMNAFLWLSKTSSPLDPPQSDPRIRLPQEGLAESNYPRTSLKPIKPFPTKTRGWILAVTVIVTGLIYAVTYTSNPEVFLLLGAVAVGSAVWSLAVGS